MRLLAAERDELVRLCRAADHVAVGHGPHRDVDDDRLAFRVRKPDRERGRADERLAAVRMRQPRRRGGGERGDETCLGEPSNPVAEVAGRERIGCDHSHGPRFRVDQLGADLREHEVAEGAARLPEVEAGVARRLDGPRRRLELLRLEPLDPRVAVPELAALLGVVEVGEERLDVVRPEPERREATPRFVRLHADARPRRRRLLRARAGFRGAPAAAGEPPGRRAR